MLSIDDVFELKDSDEPAAELISFYKRLIKNLGRVYRDVDGIAGATILGDGSVSLILDVPRVLQGVRDQERAAAQRGA